MSTDPKEFVIYALWKQRLPRPVKTRAMVFWYNLVSRINTGDDLLFLNHGYAPADGDPDTIELGAGDNRDRYAIQLYHQLAEQADWRGKDALEVSSGRGGGGAWVMRCFRPRSLVGLDIAKASTRHCQHRFVYPGLEFATGDAQDMPFEDDAFDIVFNVESSLNYPDFDAFLKQVYRVLRPGGTFLICDYRRKNKIAGVRAAMQAAGFEVRQYNDISPQIVRGLELSEPRKLEVINRYAPRFMRAGLRSFAGINGQADNEGGLFASGVKVYFSAVLHKPSGGSDI